MASGRVPGPFRPGAFGAPEGADVVQRITVGPVQTTGGDAVSGATVYLHDVATGARVQTGTTDSSGNCVFYCNNSGLYFAVVFKSGSPNVVAVTDFTLVAS